jgi:4,5-dihydroxyphthalate decarboxylase
MTIAFPNAGPVKLRTNLADYAVTRALKSGELKSDLVGFDFAGPQLAHEGFKPMVREGAFDAGELAIVTYLQARTYGKPLVLLPAVVMGRFQHQCIGYNAKAGALTPETVEGHRIGIRSYTQTTGAWIRGVLQHEHGVDPFKVTWVCFEDAHVAEYREPPHVERAPGGPQRIQQLLLAGELDGAIVDKLPKDERVRPLFPDPFAAAQAWARKHGTVPVNHLFVVNAALSKTRPDVVKEIYRVLKAAKEAAPPHPSGIDFHPFGFTRLRKAVELITQYAFEQKLIPRRFSVDELFDETTGALE